MYLHSLILLYEHRLNCLSSRTSSHAHGLGDLKIAVGPLDQHSFGLLRLASYFACRTSPRSNKPVQQRALARAYICRPAARKPPTLAANIDATPKRLLDSREVRKLCGEKKNEDSKAQRRGAKQEDQVPFVIAILAISACVLPAIHPWQLGSPALRRDPYNLAAQEREKAQTRSNDDNDDDVEHLLAPSYRSRFEL